MFPYPILTLSLLVMWLLLNEFSLGHLLLGGIIAVLSSWAMASLQPEKPILNKWYLIPKLVVLVLVDIIRSNIAVSWVILRGHSRGHHSSFITIPLEIEEPIALAILAVIVTCTPGSAWLEYDSRQRTVLIHVFDLIDDDAWRNLLKDRYETLLLEIFS